MTDRNSIIGKVDWPLLLMFFALVLIGWLSIYSAGMSEDYHPIYDFSKFCGKQMMWIGISLAVGFVILLLDAKFFDAFAFWIYALVVVLLLIAVFSMTFSLSSLRTVLVYRLNYIDLRKNE